MSDDHTVAGILYTAKSYTFRLADAIDHKADELAAQIRGSLSNSTWLPSAARPSPPPRPIPSFSHPPRSLYSRCIRWVSENCFTVCLLSTTLGITTYLLLRRHRNSNTKKRRAKRAANGARKEVLLLSGSLHDPLTKSLALDLERRGFIVFVLVNTMDDEQLILSLGGRDIRPLNLDLLDPLSSESVVSRFETYLSFPVTAFPGAVPHRLKLTGMILIPDSYFPTGPIESLSPDAWSDVLNLRFLSPVVTTKLFLRLLRTHQSKLLLLTPSITHSLTPPFHAPESAAISALSSFTASLHCELSPLGVAVTQIKLGTFDLTPVCGRQQFHAPNGARADLISWPPSVRSAYGKSYAAQEAGRRFKGSPLRELHHVVFDELSEGRSRRVVRVGSGSLVYELIGRFAPVGLVGWMLSGGRGGAASAAGKEEIMTPTSSSVNGSGSEGSERGSVEWEKVEKARGA